MDRLGRELRSPLVFRFYLDQDEMIKWWILTPFTKFSLLVPKTVEIMVPGELDRRTERSRGLHKDFSWGFATSGSPGYLGQQLKGALAGSEIRDMEPNIGVDDPDQGDIGKIQPFRDHLCADEDINFAATEFA